MIYDSECNAKIDFITKNPPDHNVGPNLCVRPQGGLPAGWDCPVPCRGGPLCPPVEVRWSRASDVEATVPFSWHCTRILAVECPTGGVVGDVFANVVEGSVVPNHMFVIVALPQPSGKRVPAEGLYTVSHTRSGDCLESAYHLRQSNCRGGPLCPPVEGRVGLVDRAREEDYGMEMVRHNHELVEMQTLTMCWQFGPRCVNHAAQVVEVNRVVDDSAEDA